MKTTPTILTGLMFILAGLVLSGCTTYNNTYSTPMPTVMDQVEPDDYAGHNPGSIYSDAEANYLFADNRARRVGDIVMINVVENSKAKTKADTTSERQTSTELGITDFFGASHAGLIPFTGLLSASTDEKGSMVGAGSSSDLDATGETKRENYVTATIGARVVKVLSGGLMQVEGAREVRVNQETQIMVVRGLIRPRDIGPDNSIPSTKMANAQVELYGKGSIGDKQSSGWFTRFLDNIAPF